MNNINYLLMAAAKRPIVELSITKHSLPPLIKNDSVNLFETRSSRKKDLKKNDDEEFQSYINLINYEGSQDQTESP